MTGAVGHLEDQLGWPVEGAQHLGQGRREALVQDHHARRRSRSAGSVSSSAT